MTFTSEELQQSFGFIRKAELVLLKRVAQSLPPSPVVVNIGAGAGTSGLGFMEARDDLLLWTVDAETGVSPNGGLGNERGAFEKAGRANDPRWHQIAGRSQSVTWDGGPIDLLFVDGDHSYESVVGDIDAWLPRVKPCGLIIFHDSAENWAPVISAIKDNRHRFGEQIEKVELTTVFRTKGCPDETHLRSDSQAAT